MLRNQLHKFIIATLAACLLSGCAMQMVSKYDDQTDANVTVLQKKLDTFFVNLKNESYPDCSYSKNKSFYDDVKVQLSGIQVRANAIPNNNITIQELDALSKGISGLEKNQKLKDNDNACLNPAIIDADQTMFNSMFTAILKLEIAKKRGEAK